MTFVLAIDLGGTTLESALVDDAGALLADSRSRRPTGPSITPEGLTAAVDAVVAETLAALPPGAELAGAGIGSAGPIDTVAGTTAPLNMPSARDFPLRSTVARATAAVLGREVVVELALDGLCITLAEHWIGAARGVDSALGMVVSTGIGGGIVSRGVPLRGGTGNAGHIGQLAVSGFTDVDVRGLEATVERIASGPNIVRWAKEQGWRGDDGEALGRAYAAGDAIAKAAVTRSAHAVGSAIASATALVDVDMVVIGGGFSHVSTDYLDLVREGRDRYAAFPFMARADIRPAALGGEAPLIGAATLVLPR